MCIDVRVLVRCLKAPYQVGGEYAPRVDARRNVASAASRRHYPSGSSPGGPSAASRRRDRHGEPSVRETLAPRTSSSRFVLSYFTRGRSAKASKGCGCLRAGRARRTASTTDKGCASAHFLKLGMSAAPGDRPRDDSFEDKGSPSQETKDGDVKHVVSLRRQTDAPRARSTMSNQRSRGAPTTSSASHTGSKKPLAQGQARRLAPQPGEAPQKETS